MKNLIFPLLLLVLAFAGCKSSILDDPSTTIQFSIPERSQVKLTVQNSYNTTVATLVNDVKAVGVYQSILEMDGLPEGIYFYTLELKGLESGSYSKKTYQIILVK
ncbi:MAG: hypothetical protein ACM3P0_00500 [Acidobacteriota bacterium]